MMLGALVSGGPVLVLATWFAAGQWRYAGPEPRAWLVFIGVVALASIIPVPGRVSTWPARRSRLLWWGWAAVAGLVVMT